jgi:hypothetical protein
MSLKHKSIDNKCNATIRKVMRINDLRNVGLAALAILSVPPLIGCEANVPGALDHTPEQGKSEENFSEKKMRN